MWSTPSQQCSLRPLSKVTVWESFVRNPLLTSPSYRDVSVRACPSGAAETIGRLGHRLAYKKDARLLYRKVGLQGSHSLTPGRACVGPALRQDTVRAAVPVGDACCGHPGLWITGFTAQLFLSLPGPRSSAEGGWREHRIGALWGVLMNLLRELKEGVLFLAAAIILAVTFLTIVFTLWKVKWCSKANN